MNGKRTWLKCLPLLLAVASAAMIASLRAKPPLDVELDGLRILDKKDTVIRILGKPTAESAKNEQGEWFLCYEKDLTSTSIPNAPFVKLNKNDQLIEYQGGQSLTIAGRKVCSPGSSRSVLVESLGSPDIVREFGSAEYYGKKIDNQEIFYLFYKDYNLLARSQHGVILHLVLVSDAEFERKWH